MASNGDRLLLQCILDLVETSSSESDSDDDIIFYNKYKSSIAKIEGYAELIVPEMTDKVFESHFRVDRSTLNFLENQIAYIGPRKDLLMVLWILASPDSFRSVADRFGVSKSTLWTACNKLWSGIAELSRRYIKWPTTDAERQDSEQAFRQMSGFPGVVGCIDGTHISIKAPEVQPEVYYNRKDFYSIVLQAVVNSKQV